MCKEQVVPALGHPPAAGRQGPWPMIGPNHEFLHGPVAPGCDSRVPGNLNWTPEVEVTLASAPARITLRCGWRSAGPSPLGDFPSTFGVVLVQTRSPDQHLSDFQQENPIGRSEE